MAFTYDYPRPAVTVDMIIIRKKHSSYDVLLIERKHNPFALHWALPGGFVDANENLMDAAHRELEEETNIKDIELKQFYTYGDKGRDPRGHTVSVVYYGFIDPLKNSVIAGDDAAAFGWFDISNLPPLAFDHASIVEQFYLEIIIA